MPKAFDQIGLKDVETFFPYAAPFPRDRHVRTPQHVSLWGAGARGDPTPLRRRTMADMPHYASRYTGPLQGRHTIGLVTILDDLLASFLVYEL